MDIMICCTETYSNCTNVLCRRKAVDRSVVRNNATTRDIEVMCDRCKHKSCIRTKCA